MALLKTRQEMSFLPLYEIFTSYKHYVYFCYWHLRKDTVELKKIWKRANIMIKNVSKLPYQERIKGAYGYLPSRKKNEGASNHDLQNQECGE